MTEEKISSPASHWRRRKWSSPIPSDQAARQGNITRMAFELLGKDGAISFLNSEFADLGGRPLAIATASTAGQARVLTAMQDLASGGARIDDVVAAQ
ncbi:hypothetical protein GCM10011515_02440 [Tsuneonella deserti]|uniref:Uncharacterized protein n=1 Tax=Tsuneonella deserti TaxID=2035528 RepID=A0ABQ1RYJ6_9SPHN|nr:hypothetical protein [Tsuneonella deserti]GGD86425.1 hypothetical protein GCM10011515_02440 [Tsuneonella deserti]